MAHLLRETGTVVRAAAGRVSVRLPRNTRCQGCKACLLSAAGSYMLSEAEDRLGARPGDEVVIEGTAPGQIGSGLVLLMLPLLLFVAGFVAASALSKPLGGAAAQAVGVAAGAGLIAAYYGAVAIRHRRAARARPAMRVVNVLRRNGGKHQSTEGPGAG